MAYEIIDSLDDMLHLKITGMMTKAELEALQALARSFLRQGRSLKILAALEGFEGWQKGEAWEETGFITESGHDASKMAFVGDICWKADALAFVGYGLRATAMEFFPPEALDEAKAWLDRP